MPNPYKNKVQLSDGTILIDISSDTVTAGTMLSGTTAHDKSGASITGSVNFVTYYTGTSDPTGSLGTNGDIYLKVVS